jgi:integrase
VDSRKLSPRSWADYKATADLLLVTFRKHHRVADLHPDDFARLRVRMATKWGPVCVGNEVNRVRVVFNYAFKYTLIDRPVVFGEGFKRPSKKTLRRHRHTRGLKMFEPGDIHRLLDAAGFVMRAMILLGVNCGYGNADCGTLTVDALDRDGGWKNHPRPKTGIARRYPLWPETFVAQRAWMRNRPTPKAAADAKLVFVTKCGFRWYKDTSDNPVSK